jgi:hypothetical protein
MMPIACGVLLVTGAYPLFEAWRANRRTALSHAVGWTFLAWAAWVGALVAAGFRPEAEDALAPYLALCLTGCAAVAVLGARRPGVAAWDVVVGGLLAVLLLPVAEGWFSGGVLRLEWFRVLLVGGVLAVGVLNYLPTRLGPAALCLAVGGGVELFALPEPERGTLLVYLGWLALALAPWVAYGEIRRRAPARSEVDRLWLDFRDRFGLVWGQRLREQFNRSAAHAGWPVVLSWQGVRCSSREPPREEMTATLRALMKRFGPEDV